MPNWKKVIVSGSDAALNSLTVTNGITGSLYGTSSWAEASETASYVNPLFQDVIITGSLTVSGSNSVVNLQELQFDTEHSASGHSTGRIYWDDNNKTFTGDMQGSDVRLQIGQEEHVYVFNNSGVTINNGDAVRISGANGANVTVTKAVSGIRSFKAAIEQDQILGLATEQIADNRSGYITTFGSVRDLDTSAFSEGDILYLSQVTSGSYTNVRPPAPNFEARVGVVQIANATEGVVLVNRLEPTFLSDISQVTSSGVIPNEKTYLVYDDSTDLISFTNEFSGSFSGSFQGQLGPISNATYRLTSSFYTASVSDYRIGVRYTQTGSVSIQLPLITDTGEIEYRFKDEEGNAKKNNITIVASGSNLIDGDRNAILNRNYMAISLYNDGVSNWFIE